jgi:hypothetical protein
MTRTFHAFGASDTSFTGMAKRIVVSAIGAQIKALAHKRLRRKPKPIISARSRGVWSR